MKQDYMNFFEVDEDEFDVAMKQVFENMLLTQYEELEWIEMLLVA